MFLLNRHPDAVLTMTWPAINRLFGDDVPAILSLVDLVLSIPATSVEAERGFSVLKLTKTENRNRLANPSLNNLLRIKLLSVPEEAFDPQPAINHWLSVCKRRMKTSDPVSSTPSSSTGPAAGGALDDNLADMNVESVDGTAATGTAHTSARDELDDSDSSETSDQSSDSDDLEIIHQFQLEAELKNAV